MKRVASGLALLLLPVLARAYPEGAPPAHTGGFKEPHCGACHLGEAQSGALTLSGLPGIYVPGKTYTLALGLPETRAAVAGLQLSVRFMADGGQAGELRAGAGQQLQREADVAYLTHSEPLALSPEAGAWTLEWTAPVDRVAPVVIHAAVVAGNDDESPLGDKVYLLSLKAPGQVQDSDAP